MKERETKLLLIEAKHYRDTDDFPNALAHLHRIINEHPKNDQYSYLLASTYFEAKELEAAKKYAERTLEINASSKEAWELKGMINQEEKQYTEAEKCYLQALEIDSNFYKARVKLLELYFSYLNDYPKTEEHCEYLLEHQDPDRMEKTKKEKTKITEQWFFQTIRTSKLALIKQKKYKQAIERVKEEIKFFKSFVKINHPSYFVADEFDIYKLYYLDKDEENLIKYKEYLNEKYDMDEERYKFLESGADRGKF